MKIKRTVVRALLVFLAVFSLGTLAIIGAVSAYHARHRSEHRQRLERVLASHPTEPQLRQILGSPWQAGSTGEAIALAQQNWGRPTFSISADITQRAPRTLIYLVGDMVYLLFIDSTGTIVDFLLLYN